MDIGGAAPNMSELELQAETRPFFRLNVASNAINRAVVRSRTREELLNEVVRILVKTGGFAMASIAWHDSATNRLVRSARFGSSNGYEGQDPAETAFREGIPYVSNDFQNDPRMQPSAAFPIEIGGSRFGVLSVFAPEPGMFGADQVELLQQISLDLAFGIQHLDGEEQRRKAEAALSASEQNLKLAMDAAGLGTFDWNLETGKAVWSGHHEQMFGFEPGGFDGTHAGFEKCIHPEDLPKLRRAVDAARDSGGAFSQELRVVWPDGIEHWVLGQGGFLYSDSGRPIRKYGVVLDISERKRVEAALLESEARLQQAVRVANIGIFDHDHISDTIYASPRDREINGIDPDVPITLPSFIECVHPADRERIGAAVQRSLDPAGDGFFDVENRLLLPDGTTRWTSTRAQTFFENEGAARRPVRTVGAVREITEQKLAEDEQKKLTALVAMNRDFIGICTLDGQGVYLNQAGSDLVGLSTTEASQVRVFDGFAETHRKRASDEIFPALFNSGYWRGESRFRHFKTGEPIDVEITAFVVRGEDDAPLYIATIARDIRELKRSEEEKARLKDKLFQAQKMESIGRLAGGVAHDFNNLLTVINGHSHLLLARLSADDPLREKIAEINNAGESAAALTRQLLAYSRKQVLEPRVLDLNHAVEDTQPMLQRLLGEGVEVRVHLHAASGLVHADPHQLERILMNLAVNARDAMPGGGGLVIETAGVELDSHYADLHPDVHAGRYVMLAVTDTGVGMDDETRRRVFEPFFTTKPVGQGTGLGLATVQGIVAQSGGHIEVSSEPGKGTTFKIYLPALDDAAVEAARPAGVQVPGGTETVLVVEDLAAVLDYVVVALRAYGYRVIPAGTSDEALRICERNQEPIHMLLTDVVMPKLSGPELVKQLAERRPEMKVLFMSGYSENAAVLRSGEGQAIHFIEKPFNPQELAAKVREVLNPPSRAARILVADDEAGVRGFLRDVLEQGGYDVVEAENGKRALQAVRVGQVDLVITDLVMPEQEGIETMQVLRKIAPGIPVIAISGAFGGQYLKHARILGAAAVLSKPVNAEQLLDSVSTALTHP